MVLADDSRSPTVVVSVGALDVGDALVFQKLIVIELELIRVADDGSLTLLLMLPVRYPLVAIVFRMPAAKSSCPQPLF